MDAFELMDRIVNGKRAKVIRVRLTLSQIKKLEQGKLLDFKAGPATIQLSKK